MPIIEQNDSLTLLQMDTFVKCYTVTNLFQSLLKISGDDFTIIQLSFIRLAPGVGTGQKISDVCGY